MHNSKGVILALFCLIHAKTIFTSNYPVDSFAISCGSSSRTIARDGRAWLEDVSSISSSFHTLSGKSTTSDALHQAAIIGDPTPYNKARISHHEFTYTFHVRPGQKFIRLHFFPAAYKGFQKSTSIFSVKAGKFTFLTNFSPALEADASAGLYFTRDSDLGAVVVGQKYKFYIDNATALEMVKRINIGGNFIPPVEDESMFRGWDSDFDSLTQADSVPINRNVKIQYKGGLSYLAPMRVYQSAKTTRPETKLNRQNLTWRIFVDSGFRYFIRLHFCELEPEAFVREEC